MKKKTELQKSLMIFLSHILICCLTFCEILEFQLSSSSEWCTKRDDKSLLEVFVSTCTCSNNSCTSVWLSSWVSSQNYTLFSTAFFL